MLKNLRLTALTKYIFLSLLLTFILIFIWFKPGLLLAKAEEGFIFYNPQRIFNIFRHPVNEVGLGLAHAFHLPRLTFFALTSFLKILGFNDWFIQALIFGFLLLVPLISTFVLIKYLFSNSKSEIAVLASFFYLFNLFTMSQVWGRFIYPLIFLWAYLPLFLVFWIKWVREGELSYVFYLLLTSIFFSTAFGLASSIFVIWTPALIFSFIHLWSERKKNIMVRTFIGISAWVIVNIWWLYPLLALSNTTYSSFLNFTNSLESLNQVSKYYPINETVLLRQKYVFGEMSSWYYFYNQNTLINLSKLIFIITLVGVFVSRKEKFWKYILTIFLVSFFLVKGTNPPLGREFFIFLYTKIPASQVLRNPYEKFGSLVVLAYSMFFSYGLVWSTSKFGKLKRIFLIGAIFLFFVYLPLPYWNGELFPESVQVRIPSYYEEANEHLLKRGDYRILQLPFLYGAGVEYTWKYSGEEPSEFLFSRPSISKNFSIPQLDDFYYLLGQAMRNNNFSKLLSITNVGDVVIHKDVVKSSLHQEDFGSSKNIVETWDGVEYGISFGALEIYNLSRGRILNRIYTVEKITNTKTLEDGLKAILSDDFNVLKDAVNVVSQNNGMSLQISSLSSPQIDYLKKHPGRYKVEVKGASEPYVLILANNFDKHWQAKIGNEIISEHFEVNGFANGWIIDKKGDYMVDIYFLIWPWDK